MFSVISDFAVGVKKVSDCGEEAHVFVGFTSFQSCKLLNLDQNKILNVSP